jgi:hypothetical protein
VCSAADSLANTRSTAGGTALAARQRSPAGTARAVRAVVGAWLVGSDARPNPGRLSSDGAPLGAGLPGRRPGRSAGGCGRAGASAPGGCRFRQERCGPDERQSPGAGRGRLGARTAPHPRLSLVSTILSAPMFSGSGPSPAATNRRLPNAVTTRSVGRFRRSSSKCGCKTTRHLKTACHRLLVLAGFGTHKPST